MKRHAKQIAKNTKVATSTPIATTIIVESDGNGKKKAKKDLEERRRSGDFPPAVSVRVDDLASLEGDDESKADRKVRFGKPQSKGGIALYVHYLVIQSSHRHLYFLFSNSAGYTDSIAGLRSGASPHASLTPSHSALKHQDDASKNSSGNGKKGTSPGSTSLSSLKKGNAKKNNTGGKASSNFLAGRAN